MPPIAQKLLDEVGQRLGMSASSGHVVTVSGDDGVTLSVDFSLIDSLGCAFRELRLNVPALVGCETGTLEAWADALSKRITYLLEGVGPVEIDEQAGKVLVRSQPPLSDDSGSEYYEVLLESDTQGNFTLRRYRSDRGTPGRRWVDITITIDVLGRLAGDLVDTIPDP